MRSSRRLPGAWRDAALYAGGAGVCALAALASSHAIHGRVARWALPVYLAAAVLAAVLGSFERRSEHTRLGLRVALAVGVLAVAGIGAQALLVSERAADPSGHHSHSETALVEEGARTLVEGENPYDSEFDGEGISFWSPRIRSHLPFLPAMLAFGLPRALLGDSPLADGRVVFLAAALAALAAALALWRAPGDRKLLVFQVLLVLPTGTLIMAGGGHDLPVLALLLLSLVLLDRRRFGWSALVLGVAVAMRQNAAVCLPFFALAAGLTWRPRVRYGATALAAGLAAVLPFGLWNAAALFEDTVLWPVNLGHEVNNAEAPTVGSLVVGASSAPGWLVTSLLFMAATAAIVWLSWRRPPRNAAQAAFLAGTALLLLVVLAPSGRFGYLLYPVNLLVWSWTLRSSRPDDELVLDLTDRHVGRRAGANESALPSEDVLEPGGPNLYATWDSNPEPAD